jgi:hypothetical protein
MKRVAEIWLHTAAGGALVVCQRVLSEMDSMHEVNKEANNAAQYRQHLAYASVICVPQQCSSLY